MPFFSNTLRFLYCKVEKAKLRQLFAVLVLEMSKQFNDQRRTLSSIAEHALQTLL